MKTRHTKRNFTWAELDSRDCCTSEQDNNTSVEDDIKLPLAQLLNLIQELPSRYRLVFSMYQLDGYSHKEISELLSISTGTFALPE